jgi:hypothetical protein
MLQNAAFLLPKSHKLGILCLPEGFPQRAKVNRFQKIGLALRVIPHQQIDAGGKINARMLDITEICDLNAIALHN